MKQVFIFLTVVFITIAVNAQTSDKMSYQAVVRNNSGSLITEQEIGMKISILQGSETGDEVYYEVLTTLTNINGLLSIEIGSADGYNTLDWSNEPFFLKTEIDPEGGTNYTIIGVSQFLSVPYALHAKSAESITGGFEELQNLSDVIEINNSANDQIKDLTDPTDTQDAATKSYVDGVVNLSVSLTGDTLYVGSQWVIIPGVSDANSSGSDDIVDGSGNIYTSVVIGDQEWLVENLKTTKYINGTDIPNETDGTSWANLSTPAYCWYDNDEAQYANPYGALYNWFAVDAGDLCPLGWHVPTGDEWGILKDELGGITSAGGKLKETGFEHWLDPNTGATNESGFTATGSGRRDNDGTFEIMMMNATFWGSTPGSIGGQGNNAILSHESVYFVGGSNISYWFETGMTVRCIKDSGSTSSKSQNNQVDIKKLEKIHQENSDLFFIGE